MVVGSGNMGTREGERGMVVGRGRERHQMRGG